MPEPRTGWIVDGVAEPPDAILHTQSAFTRDDPTLLSYGALASYAFCLYAFGPALALLRGELGLSYAFIGACSAAWAAGAMLAGAGFAWSARRLGLRALLWWSAAATAAGAVLLACATTSGSVLAAAGVLGLAGTMLQTVTQAVLSDRHGPGAGAARALAESNVGAGACALAAPVMLGLLAGSWRVAMAIPVAALGGLGARFRRLTLARPLAAGGPAAPLPAAAWFYMWLIAAGVGAEFCVVYFGAELIERNAGFAASSAVTTLSMFYLGILAGRAGGSLLAAKPDRVAPLLWGSLAVTGAGLTATWLSDQMSTAVAGLFFAGLGVANLFPLSLALALGTGSPDLVNGRSQLLSGLTVIVAPLALGTLADQVGLRQAFLIGPLLVVAAALLLTAANRTTSRRPARPPRGVDGPPTPSSGANGPSTPRF